MPWSWKFARIAGIDVYVHATFFMVIGWIGLLHWNESQSLSAVVEGVGFILTLFGCVVLHEYGHALTAARYGYARRCRRSAIGRTAAGLSGRRQRPPRRHVDPKRPCEGARTGAEPRRSSTI
jgi:hypothetical protein